MPSNVSRLSGSVRPINGLEDGSEADLCSGAREKTIISLSGVHHRLINVNHRQRMAKVYLILSGVDHKQLVIYKIQYYTCIVNYS